MHNRLLKFGIINLRGAGQVIFQNNAVTGLFFLFAIYVASTVACHISVFALLISTITGFVFGHNRVNYEKGLYGYNGLLIGAMFATFFSSMNLGFLALSCIAGTLLQIKTEKYFKRLPQLTFPFVITSWIFFLLLPLTSKSGPQLSNDQIIFHSISQVFLLGNNFSGLLILVGLLINSWKSALWTLAATLLTWGISALFSIEVLGFSAVLTAVALGDIFPLPNRYLKTLLAIVASIILQYFMNQLLKPMGVSALTAPFILITWLTLKLSKP